MIALVEHLTFSRRRFLVVVFWSLGARHSIYQWYRKTRFFVYNMIS